jgi:CO/xanthine dehydrogenase Mo-binding subunit
VALQERVEIRDGTNANLSFDTYPILRQTRSPEIEVVLVEPPGVPRRAAERPLRGYRKTTPPPPDPGRGLSC